MEEQTRPDWLIVPSFSRRRDFKQEVMHTYALLQEFTKRVADGGTLGSHVWKQCGIRSHSVNVGVRILYVPCE